MFFFDPSDHLFAQVAGEGSQFFRLLGAHLSGRFVFGGVSLGAAGVEVVGVRLAVGPKDEREGLQGAVVREVFLRSANPRRRRGRCRA